MVPSSWVGQIHKKDFFPTKVECEVPDWSVGKPLNLAIPHIATHTGTFSVGLPEAVAVTRFGTRGERRGGRRSPPDPITLADTIVIAKSNAPPTLLPVQQWKGGGQMSHCHKPQMAVLMSMASKVGVGLR
jgi:hypothetical protein